MPIDLSLTAVPIQVNAIFNKAIEKSTSEYADLLPFIYRAFENDFKDIVKQKKQLIENIDIRKLMNYYDYEVMAAKGIYKANQIDTHKLNLSLNA